MNQASLRMLGFVVLLAGLVPVARAGIATVTEDIRTSFATYHPVAVNVTPAARQYTVAPDFSNVSNFSRFTFTEAQKALLRQNGFVAVPSQATEMHTIYVGCEDGDLPAFVTVDLGLHMLHKQFDCLLKGLEKRALYGALKTLTAAQLAWSKGAYAAATGTLAREALRANTAYFAVAGAVLGTTTTLPAEVQALADPELAKIKAHAGESASSIFLTKHDYSQFTVRGHYEGDAVLEAYFRAMMWYGYMRFALKPPPLVLLSETELRRLGLQALLITQRLRGNAEWKMIYEPTNFLVGASDGTGWMELAPLAEAVYGAGWGALTPDALAETTKLDAFLARARALPLPKTTANMGLFFSLMGQRYIPDSYILNETMTDQRLPRGLDVMAVLGSARAQAILRDTYAELDTRLATKLTELKAKFDAYPAATWVQNAYWNWLYCLVPVLEPKGAGYPPYMRTPAWADKDLAAALGSWAELRHDTILYAFQGGGSTSVPPMVYADQGAVEPNPRAFARLAAMFQYLQGGLGGLGIELGKDMNDNLDGTRDLLLQLTAMAAKELEGRTLTSDEYYTIKRIGSRVRSLLSTDDESDGGGKMAVIADVISNDRGVQEEAVGWPLELYVIADVAGDLRVMRGAAFSYYEFKQPVGQRLTDSQWRTMLNDAAKPVALPEWTGSYVNKESVLASLPGRITLTKMGLVAGPQPLQSGQPLTVTAQLDLESGKTLEVLVLPPGGGTTVTLAMTRNAGYPASYSGAAATAGWRSGTCTIEARITGAGKVIYRYREQVAVTGRNGARPQAWRRME